MSGNNWNNWPSQQDQPPQGYYNNYQYQGENYQQQNVQRAAPQRMQNPRMANDNAYQAPHSMNYQAAPQYQNQQRQQHYGHPMQQNYMMMHRQQPHQQPFMFNANANVFVPRTNVPMHHSNYSMQQQHGYYGQQPGNSNLQHNFGPPSSSYGAMYSQEDTGIDAFAQFGQQSQQYMPSKELYDQMAHCKSSSLLNEIQVGCEQLIAEGEEDSSTWTTAIRQRFDDRGMDEESKKIGVKLIVEMAYSMEPNQFRGTDPQYTFSILLKMLSSELNDFMRKVVLPVLNEYHDSRKLLENDARVYMAVFYAEVFVKLTLDNGSRFEKLGEALTDQIDEILKFSPKDDYMKCLLRAFKVSGAELDASESLRRRVDQILTTMGGFARGSPALGESVKAQILSLIECRQRGWDRVPAGAEPSSAGRFDQDSFDESTDNDLTEEERQFLESHLEQADNQDGDDEIDDQEVMKEFGKFVKEELLRAEDQKTTDMLANLNVNKPDSDN